jgi:hypothetical protein
VVPELTAAIAVRVFVDATLSCRSSSSPWGCSASSNTRWPRADASSAGRTGSRRGDVSLMTDKRHSLYPSSTSATRARSAATSPESRIDRRAGEVDGAEIGEGVDPLPLCHRARLLVHDRPSERGSERVCEMSAAADVTVTDGAIHLRVGPLRALDRVRELGRAERSTRKAPASCRAKDVTAMAARNEFVSVRRLAFLT